MCLFPMNVNYVLQSDDFPHQCGLSWRVLLSFLEQDRNVTVGTHIDVVPSTATIPRDSSRQPSNVDLPSGRPNRFDPLPVITTGSGNALPPNKLTQQSR